MANVYDELDIEFSWNGDLILSDDRDIADTSRDGLLSLLQEIHDIAKSEFDDWEIYPNRGAGLDDFVGEPNIQRNADAIHDRLRVSIISAGLVLEDDLELRVIPVHIHRILIVVKINATPAPTNKLENPNQPLITALVYDFAEKGIFFLDKIPKLQGSV